MQPTLRDVMNVCDELWPEQWAESWDSVGLAVGNPSAQVSRIVCALDPTDAVIDEAIGAGADLLFTHHPLLLRGVKTVAADTLKGGAVHKAIAAGLALFNAHTNADSAPGGVTDVLADVFGLADRRPLVPVPGAEDQVGLGRVGELPEPSTVTALARRLAAAVPVTASGVRIAGDPDVVVHRLAVLGGAGDSEFDAVRAAGAQAYVTSDLRHHPASEAVDTGRRGASLGALIDVSHFAAESPWVTVAAKQLGQRLGAAGGEVRVAVSHINTDPWTLAVGQGERSEGALTWL